MPRFYRMPVFYLAALLVATGFGLRSLGRRHDDRHPAPTSEPVAESPTPPPAAAVAEPSDGIMRTADGLRRKVVIKNLDVVCRSEPVIGRPVGGPLDYFAIRFVYGK